MGKSQGQLTKGSNVLTVLLSIHPHKSDQGGNNLRCRYRPLYLTSLPFECEANAPDHLLYFAGATDKGIFIVY
jgi:hypothetical protein